MDLSIIILNYKSAGLTKQCLKNLYKLNFSFQFEVIVVDNASNDQCGVMIRENFSQVIFIQSNKNLGMGGGNNLGIAKALGRYILILNPDVVVSAGQIEKIIKFMDEKEQVGIVGPLMLNPDGSRQESCWRWHKPEGFLYRRTFLGNTKRGQEYLNHYSYKDRDLSRALAVDWVLGGCCVIRKKALQMVGNFDEFFFLFMEDTDLCLRMWRHSWQVWYLPQAEFIHYPHRLSGGNLSWRSLWQKTTWHHIASWLKYFWKWRLTEKLKQ